MMINWIEIINFILNNKLNKNSQIIYVILFINIKLIELNV